MSGIGPRGVAVGRCAWWAVGTVRSSLQAVCCDLQQLAPVLQAVYGPPVSVAPDLASARGMAKALLSGPATGMNW